MRAFVRYRRGIGAFHVAIKCFGVIALMATTVVPGLSAGSSQAVACSFPAVIPADASEQPRAEVWEENRLPAEAMACLPIGSWQPDLMIRLTAMFSWSGDLDGLLARIGNISSSKGAKYWSVTEQRWQELILDAAALDGPDESLRRQDFLPIELRSREDHYYVQYDNRSFAGVVYRLAAPEIGDDSISVATENLTEMSYFWIYGVAPGDLRSFIFIRRVAADRWSYIQIAAARLRWATTIQSVQSSLINRMATSYRHLAGIPTDREPPVRPN